jgi:hypothetical protein
MVHESLRSLSGDGVQLQLTPEEQVSRKQWVVTVVLGLAAVCLFFCAGSYLGLRLTGGAPDLSPVLARPTAPGEETPSATVVAVVSATATATKAVAPSPTAKGDSPSPVSTLAVPPTIPSGRPTVMPEEPVVPDEWEPDDSPEDASPIEMGGVQVHNLHVGGDQDWAYFEAEGGGSYMIETSNLGREIDTVVTLYDRSGTELASDDDGGEEFGSSRLFWVVEEGGRLYVQVRGLADTEEGLGTGYEVSVTLAEGFRMDEYEPDDSTVEGMPIEMGETQRHNRHVSGDEDWVSFQAEAGTTYVFETSRLGDRADTVVYLYDESEARASRLRWTAPSSGLFFVKVANWLPTLAGPGTGYDLTLRPPRGG